MRQISPEWDAGWEGGMSILEGRSTIEPFWNISGYTLPHQQGVYNLIGQKKQNQYLQEIILLFFIEQVV